MLPILYTFRRCPYAIRARITLSYANILREEREVDLKNKPPELIRLSPKATVPVLVLDNGVVLDQSLDIMKWALKQSDPDTWFSQALEKESEELIHFNDHQFKPILDNYKYWSRAEIKDPLYYRKQAEEYLDTLNKLLGQHHYLLADHITYVDIALFPFIRQFYMVDEKGFMSSGFSQLSDWLQYFLKSDRFLCVMKKV